MRTGRRYAIFIFPDQLKRIHALLLIQIPELSSLKAMKVNDLKELCKNHGMSLLHLQDYVSTCKDARTWICAWWK
jgi:hypothetical protein